MRNIILHIGRSKTGTTSLQHFFNLNYKWLYDNGYEYTTIYRKNSAHHLFSRKINRKALKNLSNDEIKILIREVRNDILDNTSEDKTIIMSSEGMQACNPLIIRRIFNEKYFNVKIVCYFRDQISFLSSSYTQGVHESLKIQNPEDYVRTSNPNYYEFITAWKNSFKDVVVKNFSKKSLLNEDIVDDFIEGILLLKISNRKKISANPSLTRRYLAFKLMLNKQYENGIRNKLKITDELYQLLGYVSKLDNSGKFMLSKADAEYIYEKYRESNEKFFSEYMPNEEIYKFNENYIDQEFYQMSEEEFQKIYNTLVQMICSKKS